MTSTDQCPLCTAWITYEWTRNVSIRCQMCSGEFLVSTWETGGHSLRELKRVEVNLLGAMMVTLHPIGTQVCCNCGRIYPVSFTCCPRLATLAIRAARKSKNAKVVDAAYLFLAMHRDVASNVLLGLVSRHRLDTNDPILPILSTKCGTSFTHQ